MTKQTLELRKANSDGRIAAGISRLGKTGDNLDDHTWSWEKRPREVADRQLLAQELGGGSPGCWETASGEGTAWLLLILWRGSKMHPGRVDRAGNWSTLLLQRCGANSQQTSRAHPLSPPAFLSPSCAPCNENFLGSHL